MTLGFHDIHPAQSRCDVTSLCSAEGAAGNRPREPLSAARNGAKMEKGI
jgi:hypothetical protein